VDDRHRAARIQERAAAKKFQAKQHRGSGSGSKPNDSHTAGQLIENKTVLEGKRQITLKADDLALLVYHAAVQSREPVLHIRLAGKNWVLITEDEFVERFVDA
jgi:Holliday junction resolvase